MPIASTSSLLFRHTTPADLDFVLSIEQKSAEAGFVSSWSRDQHAAVFSDPGRLHLLIASVPEGEPLGFLLLAGLESPHRSVELRRIVVWRKGEGIGRQAVRLLKRYVFEDRGAHRLWLDVKDFNHRARALYRSEGFVEEGTLRECLSSPNGFESLVLMSMLESEYKPQGTP